MAARGSARLLALAVVLLAVLAPASSGGARIHSPPQPVSGLGTWVDIYSAEWADPEAAVAAMARARRPDSLPRDGQLQPRRARLPAERRGALHRRRARGGVQVVAWYLPSFLNVKIDARKALGAIRFRSATGQRFNGFALDIEATKVRSLTLRNHRLLFLSARLRHAVPRRYHARRDHALAGRDVALLLARASRTARSPTTTRRSCRWRTRRCATSTPGRGRARSWRRPSRTIRNASGDPKFPIHIIGGLSGSMGAKDDGRIRQGGGPNEAVRLQPLCVRPDDAGRVAGARASLVAEYAPAFGAFLAL